MAADELHLLKRAQHKREQAERARRLARATSAADVAERLLLYAGRLDEQARKLEERVVQMHPEDRLADQIRAEARTEYNVRAACQEKVRRVAGSGDSRRLWS